MLFLSPILLGTGFLGFLFFFGKEFLFGLDNLIRSDQKYLIGYAYNEQNYRYLKWRTIMEKDCFEVWALGSSRVLQFRSRMFEKSFFNVGYTMEKVSDFLPFMKSIPEDKYPEFILLGLDQWMFNAAWDSLEKSKPVSFWKDSYSVLPGKRDLKMLTLDILNQKVSTGILFSSDSSRSHCVGFNAVLNKKGFRRDGSMDYGKQEDLLLRNDSSADDYAFSETFRRIEKGKSRFEYGKAYNPLAIAVLEEFLRFCSVKKIRVLAFLPPFAVSVNRKMDQSGKYAYLKALPPALHACCRKYGLEFFDLSHPEEFGSGDFETIDGFHGSEKCYQKMLLHLFPQSRFLKDYVRADKLEKDLNSAPDRLRVYID